MVLPVQGDPACDSCLCRAGRPLQWGAAVQTYAQGCGTLAAPFALSPPPPTPLPGVTSGSDPPLPSCHVSCGASLLGEPSRVLS